MCAIYEPPKKEQLGEHFDVSSWRVNAPDYKTTDQHGRAYPGYHVPVVLPHSPGAITFMQWGVWVQVQGKYNLVQNARKDKLTTSPVWRSCLKERRCLIPIARYLEPAKLQPQYGRNVAISINNLQLCYAAGIYTTTKNKAGQEVIACSMITTDPNPAVALVHNRMPAILNPRFDFDWLQPGKPVEQLLELLQPYPEEYMQFSAADEAHKPIHPVVDMHGFDRFLDKEGRPQQ